MCSFLFVCLSYMRSQLKQWQQTCRCAGWLLAVWTSVSAALSAPDWLASLKLAKSDFHWEHVVADPSPRYAYRPIVCDSWSYLRRREGGSAEPTSDFAFQRLSSGSGAHLAPREVGAPRGIAAFQVPPGHTPTSSSLVAVQRSSACAKQQPTRRRTPTQTNKHTCCSRRSAEGGKTSKTNSLIYMTVACFTLAGRSDDGAELCWKQQVMKSDRPVCCVEPVQEGEARIAGSHPMQRLTRLPGGALLCGVLLWLCYCRADISAFSGIFVFVFP